MKVLLTSAAAAARLQRAREWLAERPPGGSLWVIGATQEAASDALRHGLGNAAFGWRRITLGRLAAQIAARELARRALSPISSLGLEALCARVVHRLAQDNALGRFQPVSAHPGLSRALSRTLQEARLGQARLEGDLGRILQAYEDELQRAGLADRAEVFRIAVASPGDTSFD